MGIPFASEVFIWMNLNSAPNPFEEFEIFTDIFKSV